MNGHAKARAGLCLVCLDKSLVPITTAKFEGLVTEYLIQDFNLADDRLPSGLCGSCSQKLRAYERLDFTAILPDMPMEYSTMLRFRPPRGVDAKCLCFLCTSYQTVGLRSTKKRKRKRGRPWPESDATLTTSSNTEAKQAPDSQGCDASLVPHRGVFCLKCFGLIYRGCHHPCTSASSLENLRKLVPQRSLEILASDSLKEKISKGVVPTLATRGNPLRLLPMDAAHKKMIANSQKSVTLEDLKRAKNIAGVSGNVALKFVRQIRGSVKVEPGFKEALAIANRKFSSLFAVEEEVSPLDSSKMYIVFCRRPMEFFDSILAERGSTASDVLLRLSIDEGRGFLKISGNLVFRHAHLETHPFKSSGVKRTFLLAIAPIKEAYEHIKMMLAKLDLDVGEDLEEFYSQDLKCFNIICGLGNHASTRPCIYCLWVNGC